MRHTTRILAAFMASVTITSCAVREPIVEGPTVIIIDSIAERTQGTAHVFELVAINGVDVKVTTSSRTRGANSGNGMQLIAINPHYHYAPRAPLKLTVRGSKYFAAPVMDMFGKSMAVEGEVSVVPGEIPELHVVGSLGKSESSVWIADKDGNALTDKVTTRH